MTMAAQTAMLWSFVTPYVFLIGIPTIVVCLLLARVIRKRVAPRATGAGALVAGGAVFVLHVLAAAIVLVLVVTGLSAIG